MVNTKSLPNLTCGQCGPLLKRHGSSEVEQSGVEIPSHVFLALRESRILVKGKGPKL